MRFWHDTCLWQDTYAYIIYYKAPKHDLGCFFIDTNFNKTETKPETFANISGVGYGQEVRKHEK